MEALKTRLLALCGALAVLGWGLFIWAIRRPIPAPTERIVTQVQYVDRVVDRVVEKKTTKPNGTVVETRSVTQTLTQEKVGSSSKLIVPPPPAIPQYSLGLAWSPDRVWVLDGAARLGDSPLWLTGAVSSKKQLTLGIRYEF